MTRTWTTPSPEWLWDHAKGMAPAMTALIENLGPTHVAAVRKVFLDTLHDEFGNGPVNLDAEAHIAIGVK